MKFNSNKRATGTHALTILTPEHEKQGVQRRTVAPEDSGATSKARSNSGFMKAMKNTGTRKQVPEQGIIGEGNSGTRQEGSEDSGASFLKLFGVGGISGDTCNG